MATRDGKPTSPTGDRTDTTHSGLRVGQPVVALRGLLLVALIAPAVVTS